MTATINIEKLWDQKYLDASVPFPIDGAASGGIEQVHTVASSGAATTLPDITTAVLHMVTVTANTTITLPAVVAGKSVTVLTVQDGTGGRTIAWASPSGSVLWPGGATPTYTATAAARDLTTFLCVDGANWMGLPAGYDLR